jgi:hypothetical protein
LPFRGLFGSLAQESPLSHTSNPLGGRFGGTCVIAVLNSNRDFRKNAVHLGVNFPS